MRKWLKESTEKKGINGMGLALKIVSRAIAKYILEEWEYTLDILRINYRKEAEFNLLARELIDEARGADAHHLQLEHMGNMSKPERVVANTW